MEFQSLLDLAKAKEKALMQAKNEYQALAKMESLIDKKQQDILHCLELNKYNAVDLMRLVKNLILCRKMRREIKTKKGFAQRIHNVQVDKLNYVMKDIEAYTLTDYKPKIMKNIFDPSEFSEETLRKEVK